MVKNEFSMADSSSLPLFNWGHSQVLEMVEEHRCTGGRWLGKDWDSPVDVGLVGLDAGWREGGWLTRDFVDSLLLPDGLLVGATLVRGSLEPLIQLGVFKPPLFPDFGEVVEALSSSKLALSVATADMLTLTFPTALRALDVLAEHGFSLNHPESLERLENHWRALRPREDGRLEVDFSVAFVSGFRPAPGQPVPLLPGGGVRVRIEERGE